MQYINPDSKVHGANMGPTGVLSAPDGPYVVPMNLAIREVLLIYIFFSNYPQHSPAQASLATMVKHAGWPAVPWLKPGP